MSSPYARYVPTMFRLVVGVTFILASIAKLGNSTQIVEMVKTMAPYLGSLATVYGYVLPYAELIVGVLLVLGLFTRVAAVVGGLLFVSFIIGVGIAMLPQGLMFLRDPSGAAIPNQDLGYLAMMIGVYLLGPGAYALDNKRHG